MTISHGHFSLFGKLAGDNGFEVGLSHPPVSPAQRPPPDPAPDKPQVKLRILTAVTSDRDITASVEGGGAPSEAIVCQAEAKGLGRYFHGFRRWLFGIHGKPEEIALGFALGIFVAFSPTMGVQIMLAIAVSTLFGASRAAAVPPVFITNPATLVPIYGATYWLGSRFRSGPPVEEVQRAMSGLLFRFQGHEAWDLQGQIAEFAALGWDVLIPMTIGGAIVGAVLGAIGYGVVMTLFHLRDRDEEQARSNRASSSKLADR